MESIEIKGRTFSFAFLGNNNFSDLVRLFKSVYKINLSEDFLIKKYGSLLPDLGFFGAFMYNENGSPVGFQGAIPYRLKTNEKIFIAAQSCDSMTISSYQGLGIFSFLTKKVDELLIANKVKLIFGFPNQNSEKVLYDKLGWSQTGVMYHYIDYNANLAYAKFLWKFHFTRRLYRNWAVKKLNNFGQVLEQLPINEEGNSSIIVTHDRPFFLYKKKESTLVLKLKYGTVWIKLGTQILVGDFHVEREDRLSDFLDELKLLARKVGVSRVNYQCQGGSANQQLLELQMKGVPTWRFGGKSYDSDFSPKDLLLTYGDIDTF